MIASIIIVDKEKPSISTRSAIDEEKSKNQITDALTDAEN